MKGKRKFTKNEIDLIKYLIKQKCSADRNTQKTIRNKIRKIGFYYTDFSNTKGYTPEGFEELIQTGDIKVKGGNSNNNTASPLLTEVEIKDQKANITAITPAEVEDKLIINGTFRSASNIDHDVPDTTGFYCIKLSDNSSLPERYQKILKDREHRLLYIGKAEGQLLKERFLNQELRAIGHGTFFRSIGAVLGYKPPVGSLREKANKNNYKFSKSDGKKIIEWINSNLEVNWFGYEGPFDDIEEPIIRKYKPLLNDTHNPLRLKELREDKDECRRIARE